MAQRGLVLDLSFAGFIAVVDEEDRLLAQRWRAPGERYDDVAQWIEDCLRESTATFSDLNWIAVNVGPGSFTGIRIAMAFAQGLAMPRDIPLYGFTSFAPMLLSDEFKKSEQQNMEKLVVAIPANSGRFYVSTGIQDAGKMMEQEEFLSLADSETTVIVPAETSASENILARFGKVFALEDRWNIPALVQHAKSSNLDAKRPYYLQLSAAEEKAVG